MKYNFINRNSDCEPKTLVLVHGFTQNSEIFKNQIEFFNDTYNIILISLENHEKSPNLDEPLGIENYTDELQEIFWNLSLRKVIFWGTHTGTTIGMNLYLRNPNLFSCMILEAPVIIQYATTSINFSYNQKCDNPFLGIDHAIHTWVNSKWYDYMRENPFLARYHECERIIESFNENYNNSSCNSEKGMNIWPELTKLNLPILAYNGAKDSEDFLEMTNDLKKCLSVSTEIVPDASGFPVCENPDYVNNLVSKYIQTFKL